jgi:hypothetical protein
VIRIDPRRGTSVHARAIFVGGLGLLAGLQLVAACSSPSHTTAGASCTNGRRDGNEGGIDCGGSCPRDCATAPSPDAPTAMAANHVKDNGETDVDCGGLHAPKCSDGRGCNTHDDCASGMCPGDSKRCVPARPDDGVKNGGESDVDCGGTKAPRCALGKTCAADSDCDVACNYAKKCIDTRSCKPHLGGDTCGKDEIDMANPQHESCCRSLPVAGYSDRGHPDKTVYLDKYEITAGRIRAFIDAITARYEGKPNIRDWVANDTPEIWDREWNKFLPADSDGETIVIDRHLLGDVRPEPDLQPVPDTDQVQKTGLDFQFNGQLFVYLHGNNCSTHSPSAYGFPTFFYPPEILAKMGPDFPPRADGKTLVGTVVPASEHLEVKSMNCISNAMLAAFCHWDGGQLATDEVLDFVTGSPSSLGNNPGCGTQTGSENPPKSGAATSGGRCADLAKINATFDAGGELPLPNSPLNFNRYEYPFFAEGVGHDKAWEVSAPGRGSLAANGAQVDTVRISEGDEPWMDLAGNLNEVVLAMNGASFSGKFGLKYRGIGYSSARSELNTKPDWPGEGGLRRIERPEARAGFAGGRCMRFK